jgi:hypothetical protein
LHAHCERLCCTPWQVREIIIQNDNVARDLGIGDDKIIAVAVICIAVKLLSALNTIWSPWAEL